MTAKERAYVKRIESEIAELRKVNEKHMEVYSNTLCELIGLRAKLETLRFVLDDDEL